MHPPPSVVYVPYPVYPVLPQGRMPLGPQNGMGTAALVLGICGVVTSWMPYLCCLGVVAGVLAIVFGGIGLGKAERGEATNRSSALGGLISGVAAVAIAALISVAIGLL
ncbi:hypothetical protein GCM10009853_045110 [Glycomyces scopariae]